MQRDPEKIEIKYLHDVVDLAKARVLEIGCGEGRLTWRYAASAGHVVGTDLDHTRLATANSERPPALRSSLAFTQTRAEALPFPSQTFDLAILAWSL
jgi:ubiquinone/menaquinone biosynthesis C-methylase UbiE